MSAGAVVYYAQVTSREERGCTLWDVNFVSHSEDGSQVEGVLEDCTDEKVARDAAAFWSTGGHLMCLALFEAKRMPHRGVPHKVVPRVMQRKGL